MNVSSAELEQFGKGPGFGLVAQALAWQVQGHEFDMG